MFYRVSNMIIKSERFYDVVDDILSRKRPLKYYDSYDAREVALQLGIKGNFEVVTFMSKESPTGSFYFFGIKERNGCFCSINRIDVVRMSDWFFEARKNDL